MKDDTVKRATPATPSERIEWLEKLLQEFRMVEEVLVAAGLVSKEKIEQAHEIVRKFK